MGWWWEGFQKWGVFLGLAGGTYSKEKKEKKEKENDFS